MKHVQQGEDDYGCGVACVAMLARTSYAEARKRLFGDGEIRPTSAKAIREALTTFGRLPAPGRLTRLGKSESYRDLPFDALLKVPRGRQRVYHWIVWDARRRIFLDPQTPPAIRPRVTGYLRVD